MNQAAFDELLTGVMHVRACQPQAGQNGVQV